MRLLTASTVLLFVGAVSAASSWSFSDASVTGSSKAAKSVARKFSASEKASDAVLLGPKDSIKVSLTTLDDEAKAKRPHQAFLLVRESSGLEVPFALTLKQSGKGTVQFSQKDLPKQLLHSPSPLQASLVLGSAGSTRGSITPTFDVELKLDSASPAPSHHDPLRYGPLAEIDHTFRADPKSPPRIVSLAFALAVLASVPTLIVTVSLCHRETGDRDHVIPLSSILGARLTLVSAQWVLFGANLRHAATAFSRAPVSHAIFFGSVVGMECVFYLYHGGWNLFYTLPIVSLVGASAFLSGTKALGEVQRRRLAGER
ncbi:hypothetical protein XA68_13489 [Ophiocordyceps unilateralis]|uniref:Ribophorin II C-terminal domain-containing protein n=1 Tax=Ophiocordyceps unilateralis TaxID=268505 RepID=A0A2A9PCD4_OPHUN|nr:hypothetical protein XA68_13489 [Ophiocordyceps unilateralis]